MVVFFVHDRILGEADLSVEVLDELCMIEVLGSGAYHVDKVCEQLLVVGAMTGQESQHVEFLRRSVVLEEVAIVGQGRVDEEDPLQVLLRQITSRPAIDHALVGSAVDLVEGLSIVDHILGRAIPGLVVLVDDHGESG